MSKQLRENWSKISTAVLLLLGGASVASLSHTTNASANSRAPKITAKKRKARRASMKLINHNKLHNLRMNKKRKKRVKHTKNINLRKHKKASRASNASNNNMQNNSSDISNTLQSNPNLKIHTYIAKKSKRARKIKRNKNYRHAHRKVSKYDLINKPKKPTLRLKALSTKLNQTAQSVNNTTKIHNLGHGSLVIQAPDALTFFDQPGNGTGSVSKSKLKTYSRFIKEYKHISAGQAFNIMKNTTNSSKYPNIWHDYYSSMPKNQLASKLLVGYCESDGRWNVESPFAQGSLGHPAGRYQVSQEYFPAGHRSYSDINSHKPMQEKAAYKYMKRTYGSWANAARFWMIHHWW